MHFVLHCKFWCIPKWDLHYDFLSNTKLWDSVLVTRKLTNTSYEEFLFDCCVLLHIHLQIVFWCDILSQHVCTLKLIYLGISALQPLRIFSNVNVLSCDHFLCSLHFTSKHLFQIENDTDDLFHFDSLTCSSRTLKLWTSVINVHAHIDNLI